VLSWLFCLLQLGWLTRSRVGVFGLIAALQIQQDQLRLQGFWTFEPDVKEVENNL
jgi:hypothetical protein